MSANVLTAEEAAAALGVSVRQVYRYVTEGVWGGAVKLRNAGHGARLAVAPEDLEAFKRQAKAARERVVRRPKKRARGAKKRSAAALAGLRAKGMQI